MLRNVNVLETRALDQGLLTNSPVGDAARTPVSFICADLLK